MINYYYNLTEHKKSSIGVLRPSVFDREGAARYAVFKDLWEKGHYITSGSKFGADYLVYPGNLFLHIKIFTIKILIILLSSFYFFLINKSNHMFIKTI